MTVQPPVGEADLHAAADGRLAPDREAALTEHLAAHPDDAERIAAYRRLNGELHRVFDPVLGEATPAGWSMPGRRSWSRAAAIAAAFAGLLVGTAAGWFGRDLLPVDGPAALGLARLAAAAHGACATEVRHPVEVPADQEAHLVQWLSKRLGGEVRAPRLAAVGYQLIGGRLLPADDGVAAQFMYEDATGGRITLYVKSAAAGSRETAFRFVEMNGLSVWYWRDGAFGFALAADLPRQALLTLCNEVYAQLNPAGHDAEG